MTGPNESETDDTHGEAHGSHGDGWFDKPQNMRLVLWAFYAACAIVAVADFVIEKHPHFHAEETPVFYGWYGFLCFAGIVLIGQHLRKLVAKPEDYYDK